MKATKKRPFNVKKFLASVNGGRTTSNYGKNQAIFSQGEPADSVFHIQEGLPGNEWVILADHSGGSMQVRTLRRRYSWSRRP